jgi:Tol biopolymer transport system component
MLPGFKAGLALAAAASLTLAAPTALAAEVGHPATGHVENPVWNLAGDHIAFEVNSLSTIDLFVSEVAGASAKTGRQVALPGGGSGFGGAKRVAVNASWHPHGFVVFEATNSAGMYRLYFAQPPGVTASMLIQPTDEAGSLQYPSVAGDGSAVVYTTSATGAGDVRYWETNTGTRKSLTSTSGTEVFPAFAPTGDKVVFTRKNNGGEDVFLVDVASGAESAVAGGSGDQTRPAFAMGGSRVVFFSKASGAEQWSLMSVNANGSDRQTLGTNVVLPQRARPAISPDGQWVAYSEVGAGEFVLVKADGSSRVTIPTEHTTVREPAIANSGGRLMLAYTGLITTDSDWRRLYLLDITGKI